MVESGIDSSVDENGCELALGSMGRCDRESHPVAIYLAAYMDGLQGYLMLVRDSKPLLSD